MKLTEKYLKDNNYIGPYLHGEYYLYDEKYKRKNGWGLIMSVAPPKTPANNLTNNFIASYNGQRGMYAGKKIFFEAREIEISTVEELNKLIKKSKRKSGLLKYSYRYILSFGILNNVKRY